MKRIASIMATTALVLGLFAGSPTAVTATSYSPAAEVDHWVSKGGRLVNDASGGYSCSRPGYRLIADAADAAEPGDVIHVCRGTYLEDDIELPSDFTSGITIQGDGPNRTFVDARGNGRIFINWTYAGGVLDDSTGVEQVYASNLRIADMTLRNGDSSESDFSTGIDGFPGMADLGDQIGGAVLSLGRVDCNNVRFTNNSARAGGAIGSYFGVTSERCSFTNNSAMEAGGAIFSIASVHDSGGVYTGNGTEGLGGAVFTSNYFGIMLAYELGLPSYLTSTFTKTSFSKNLSGTGGGALAVETGCVTVRNSSFTKNTTQGAGGALYLNEFSFSTLLGGVPEVAGICSSEISDSKFESNAAVKSGLELENVGGAVAYFGGMNDYSTGTMLAYDDTVGLTVYGTTFRANAAALGGAVYMDDGHFRSIGGVGFLGNRARQHAPGGIGGYGSGIYAVDASRITGDYYVDSKNRATFELNSVTNHTSGTYSWVWEVLR
jgi:predicted outer membrane repeat protein